MPFISSIRGNYSAVGRGQGIIPWRAVAATGGTESTITVNGIQFRVHRFTSGTTNFVVSDSGTEGTVEALIVGGGAGGGFGHGAGGGGGAVLHRTNQPISATTYSIVVGAGGTTTSNASNNPGGNSSAFGVTATGGGSGANESGDDTSGRSGAGGNGANGGGGTYGSQPGGTGSAPTASGWTVYAGFNGGTGGPVSGAYATGGGAGAGGTGFNGQTNQTSVNIRGSTSGGWGADGIPNDILGNNYFWASGGGGTIFATTAGTWYGGSGGAGGGGGASVAGSGGSTRFGGIAGVGGLSAGGAGTNAADTAGGAGGVNTGSGGGGSSNENANGGTGGSGFVAIRYPLQDPTGVYPITTSAGTQAGKAAASQTGGTAWFSQSTPFWGVEEGANYRIPAGKTINRFSFREGNTTNNTALWFVVFEKGASTSQFYMIAAWRFTQATAGNGSVLTVDASAATLTRGTKADKSWTCPSGPTFGLGEYYVGWVSSDTRVGTKTSAIFVDTTEQQLASPGGTVTYVTVSAGTSGGLFPDQLPIGTTPSFPTELSGYKVASGMHIAFSFN
jgi:hypothetical protein